MIVNAGSQDVSTYFVLRKATDNTELTGVTITDIDLTYTRSGADHVLKVDATALTTPDAAHADNKAIEVDATDCPGLYRVDWPDAAFATGVKQVVLTVKYATAFTEHLLVELDPPANITQIGGVVQSLTDLKDFADAGYDPSTHKVEGVKLVDTTTTNSDMRGTNGANTVVPDAVGTAAGLHVATDGLINGLNDLSGADVKTAIEVDGGKLDHLWEMTEDDTGIRRLTANALEQAPVAVASVVADAVWEEAIADHSTGTTFGGKNQKVVPSESVNDYKATGFATPTNVTNAQTAIVAEIDANEAKIDAAALINTETRLSKLDATVSSRSSHSAADVATLILATPAQKLATDVNGFVIANLNGDLTATMKLSVNTELDNALNTAIPALPTGDSVNERLKAIDDKLPSKSYLTGTENADGDVDMSEATGNYPGTIATVTTITNSVALSVATEAQIDAIEADTNELQGLIAGSKISAQVKGIDADVLTASALNTDAVAEIATAIMAKTVDGSIDVTKALNMMVALLAGDMTKTDNTYTFKDQSGVVVFTALMSSTERNGTVA